MDVSLQKLQIWGGLEILRGSIVQILLFSAGGRRGSLLLEISALRTLGLAEGRPTWNEVYT